MNISREHILIWINECIRVIAENADYLTRLDAAIGDGDHGSNMQRGMQTVLTKLPGIADKDIGTILKVVGMTLVSTVGGASGPLYGTFFIQMDTAAADKLELTLADWIAAVESGVNGIMVRGKALPGDKTMVDVFVPALAALREAYQSDLPLGRALEQSVVAAEMGREATKSMVARKGRASYLGERSLGHLDPGATSAHLLLKAAADALVITDDKILRATQENR
jgi:phosphoenolpyruvate---glycerone phosphotransferase subunit DhaL